MLRIIGYGENIGSRFSLILSTWNKMPWLKPELIEQSELMQVEFIIQIKNKDEKPLVSQDTQKDETKDEKKLSERKEVMLYFDAKD